MNNIIEPINRYHVHSVRCKARVEGHETNLITDAFTVLLKHPLKVGREEISQVLLSVEFEAEGHDLTREAIAPEQGLHAVSLDLSVEHVA